MGNYEQSVQPGHASTDLRHSRETKKYLIHGGLDYDQSTIANLLPNVLIITPSSERSINRAFDTDGDYCNYHCRLLPLRCWPRHMQFEYPFVSGNRRHDDRNSPLVE
ncbi:hypothetical protein P3342_009964 [Pyrenophora teres f. teres]|nr:hypothetical protein P3342_009964 [Pyrenophora teres f. teres]